MNADEVCTRQRGVEVGDRFAAGGGYGEPDAPTVPVDCRAGADPDEIAVIQRADTVRKR